MGGNEESKQIATTARHNIEAPKHLGGLGIGSIKLKNLGLLLKWFWRFCNSDDQLWKNVLQLVHQLPNEFLSLEQIQKVHSGPLGEIARACKETPWFTN